MAGLVNDSQRLADSGYRPPASPRVLLWLRRLHAVAALLVIALGGMVFLGWALDLPGLRGASGAPQVKANASIGFLIAGSALWLWRENAGASAWRRRLAGGLGAVIALLGGINLAEYLFDWNAGIGEWIFRDPAGAALGHPPGRLALNAAISFVLAGGALLLLEVETQTGRRPAEWLAWLAMGPPFLAIAGYAFGIQRLGGLSSISPLMPQRAAVGFLVLSAGILAARPERGSMRHFASTGPEGTLARILVPGSVLLLLVIAFFAQLGHRAGWYNADARAVLYLTAGVVLLGIFMARATRWLAKAEGARAAAAEAARVSAQRYRSLFEGSLDSIFSLGPDGHVFSANPAATQLMGRTFDELRAVHFLELCAPDRRREAEVAFRAAFCRRCLTMETAVLTHLGERRELFITGAPTVIDGEVVGVSCIAHDITERKRAEEALRQLGQRKDEFLAMLGHELRNPLSAIRHAVALLATCEPGAEIPRWAREVVDRQSAQLSRLVDDLLDVARIQRGLVELRRESLDLSAVLRSATEAVRPVMEAKRHALTSALPAERLQVNADAARMEQVFVNLLTNAAKYTPAAGEISLTATRHGESVVVAVCDNGAGISPEVLPRIFEAFDQGERTLDRAEGGLGLGLTIVRQIVGQHGGTVTAQSDGPGRGSKFLVRLPLLVEPNGATAIDSAVPTHQANAVCRRLLVVDDNTDTLQGLARLLERRGHEVHIAVDGPQALDVARQIRPDAFLLDIGLPGMDGYQLARHLREKEGFTGALMIAISGYAQERDKQRAADAGFDRHFGKPVDLDALTALLANHHGAVGTS